MNPVRDNLNFISKINQILVRKRPNSPVIKFTVIFNGLSLTG